MRGGNRSEQYSATSSYAPPSGDYSATSHNSHMKGGSKYRLSGDSSDYSDTSAFSILQSAAGKVSSELFDKALVLIKDLLGLKDNEKDTLLARAYRTAMYALVKKEAEADKDSDKLNSAAKRAEVMIKRITKDALRKITQDELDNIIEFTKKYDDDRKNKSMQPSSDDDKNTKKKNKTLDTSETSDMSDSDKKPKKKSTKDKPKKKDKK